MWIIVCNASMETRAPGSRGVFVCVWIEIHVVMKQSVKCGWG